MIMWYNIVTAIRPHARQKFMDCGEKPRSTSQWIGGRLHPVQYTFIEHTRYRPYHCHHRRRAFTTITRGRILGGGNNGICPTRRHFERRQCFYLIIIPTSNSFRFITCVVIDFLPFMLSNMFLVFIINRKNQNQNKRNKYNILLYTFFLLYFF